MKKKSDFSAIIKSFIFIGIPLNTCKVSSVRLKTSLVLTEICFLIATVYFGIVTIANRTPNQYATFTVTSFFLYGLLLAMRISVSYKRNQITDIAEKIMLCTAGSEGMTARKRQRVTSSLCLCCYLYAAIMNINSLFALALQPDGGVMLSSAYLFPYEADVGEYSFVVLSFLLQGLHSLVFHCTPCLMYVLVGYIMHSLHLALQNGILSLSRLLKDRGVTRREVVASVGTLHRLNRLFDETEKAVSSIVFLSYTHAFASQLNLITFFLSIRHSVDSGATKFFIVMSILVTFAVTCSTIFFATSVKDCKTLLRSVVDGCGRDFCDRSQCAAYLILLKLTESSDFSFTAWEVFKLHKGVLITLYGIIITYGYLLLQISVSS